MRAQTTFVALFAFFGSAAVSARAAPESPCTQLGIFEDHADVGEIELPGSVDHDCTTGEYRLTGSGHNIWDSEDAFHYLWRRVSGDFTLTARVGFVGPGRNEYRKAGWMIRESLEPDAAYVDVVVHGNGMISLQFRRETGGGTHEDRAWTSSPADLQLVREGDEYTMRVGRTGLPFEEQGDVRVELGDNPYVGLVVCSHEADLSETAIFSNVRLER